MKELKIFKKRQCPLCKSKDSVVEVTSKTAVTSKWGLQKIQEIWDGFFKEKVHFNYHRCARCKLLFNKTYLTEEAISFLYSSMNENMIEALEINNKRTQENYVKIISTSISNEGYIEIGPGVGYFAEKINEVVKFKEIHFFEPNICNHSKLKNLGNNVNIYNSLEEIRKLPDNSVSLIVMIMVLDHLTNPLYTLNQLRKKLTKKGHVLAVTHNENSILRKLFRSKWPAFCIQHPQLYNKNTLESIFTSSGFKTVKVFSTANYFGVNFLLSTLLSALNINKNLQHPKITIKIHLGNIGYIGKK
jgi:hypothetical protein